MAIHVALNHKTQYRYDRRVTLGPQIVRLRPAPHCRTPILTYSLKINPPNHFINWQQDPQGNYLARLVFPDPTTEFLVEVDLVAEMAVFNPFDFFLEPAAENFPFCYDADAARELRPFLETEPSGPALTDWLAQVSRQKIRTIDFLVGLNQRLQTDIGYVIRMEPGVQTCEQTLGLRTGSCRDSAWLMVQILRHLGLAARFVSGYLIQLTPDVKPLEGPAGPTVDFTDLHAWAEVYLPGAGWVGLDPTSGLFAGEGHIPLACTPDASSAAPISGVLEECETAFHHEMSVQRIFESPRVTKPYTEEQWSEIEALGHKVDAHLSAGDVRLTMGGEPTFVGLDNPDAPEWTVSAFGPQKRKLSVELLMKLKERFTTGALLHLGQGKWYPGEPLPRWALACYWRTDGVPIWEDATLFADDNKDYGYTAQHARRFLDALSRRLQVDPSFIMTAFEDAFYYMWKERRLPPNVDPLDNKLEDPIERARLAKVFEQKLDKTIGYVLPLRRIPLAAGTPHWTSQPWFTASEHLFLIPGDSPMGYRLPLDSLPWTKPEDVEWSFDPDPFGKRDELPPRPEHKRDIFNRPSYASQLSAPARKAKPPEKGKSSPWVSRPALCVQAREGKLYIFMPPVEFLADYLDLVTAIEDTAAYLGMAVTIEGYTPPYDPRIDVLKVTPDPGVIEVNIQPAASWDSLVQNTTALYDLARKCRLGTEKFMLDGRHSGTGGGNHVVIGAAVPEDSAFLRRPDLLRSLVGYWQNHPALSYLFSGLFIGPTSQHPRVDEARTDALYELEIAFDQIPDKDTPNIPPWLVDRIFRNLLTDLTGNTHRTELCIDKLYAPESASSRLGLLELRAFEMPPHARMSLTQQLVVRALIAHFWNHPYRRKLVWWGTALHDRFMLPHFVELDWEDVVQDLNDAGFAFRNEWFAPHFEFRFPVIGSITKRGVNLELRNALEPWHVLGEEATAGGTARNVDSSVERLQVKVTGLIDSRFIVLCNGRRVPLHPTGEQGEFVAGVRYRAWQPPSCLHPNIPVHTPLVFDIVDTWSRRAIGGCQYHVSHPGGRANEQFPVNAYEAESRRLARFSAIGHTPGIIPEAPEERNTEYPFTLDLRRGYPGQALPSVPFEVTLLGTYRSPLLGADYHPIDGVYDEMKSPSGMFRPNWEEYVAALSELGAEELAHRWQTARQRIHENGVTYNIYGDPLGMDRPWNLDAIPVLISAPEWSRLEAGLIQRAQLLNWILADLYGPQELLRGGHLPPALVFANPGFWRPCHGIQVPRNTHIHLLAVDLARSPDGEWWVLSDRTQAPSGAGYALENRIVLASTFNDLYRQFGVRRLASFFRSFRDNLLGLAPWRGENPRVVLLTPGPLNETYFEHSYLARYLGFTLVQGGDLMVRDSRVFLKTLEGLKQVDVILRRVDGGFCDPIELRSDSFLGVAGLVEAVRAGNVVVANALGSALVETSALMPFLPGLSQRFLGERLKLPSVATWWCGQAAALNYVHQNLDNLVIKPAFPSREMEPVFGGELTGEARARLLQRLESRPYDFTGQELLHLSTAPVWSEDSFEPRRVVLRVYVAAAGGSWVVMPGGLARVSPSVRTPVVSMQRGGGSKDTWVLSDGPVDTFTLQRSADLPVEINRGAQNGLQSRAADFLYWFGRYGERCENLARILRCILIRMTSEAGASGPVEWRLLMKLHACLESTHSRMEDDDPQGHLDLARDFGQEILSLIFEEQRADSLNANLNRASRAAAQVRDRLSSDLLRTVSQLSSVARVDDDTSAWGYVSTGDALTVLNRCIGMLASLRGNEMENVTRGPGWHFLSMGRRIERSLQLIHLFRAIVVPLSTETWPMLEMLLEIGDSSMTYRSRYFTVLQAAPVLDLLMNDELNPRSLAFQISELKQHCRGLSDLSHSTATASGWPAAQEKRVEEAATQLFQADVLALCQRMTHGIRLPLDDMLGKLENALLNFSDAITHTYFSHAEMETPT